MDLPRENNWSPKLRTVVSGLRTSSCGLQSFQTVLHGSSLYSTPGPKRNQSLDIFIMAIVLRMTNHGLVSLKNLFQGRAIRILRETVALYVSIAERLKQRQNAMYLFFLLPVSCSAWECHLVCWIKTRGGNGGDRLHSLGCISSALANPIHRCLEHRLVKSRNDSSGIKHSP